MPGLKRTGLAVLVAMWLAGPALAKPPVWIVRDGDSELVLFGSVHVLSPNLDWQPSTLTQALAAADDVWFELPIDPAAESRIANIVAVRGVLPAGQSLFAMLSARDQVRLNRACRRYRLAPGLIDRLQPWYAQIALAGAAFRQAGADAESGVEAVLASLVPPGVRREAFETPEQQIDMFADAPLPAQIAALAVSLDELDDDPKSYDRLVRAWLAGNTKALETNDLLPLMQRAPDIYRRLVSDRNTAWVRTLSDRLSGQGRTVVVVGVGHLIGPDSVPAKLRALGYSVEGP